MRFTDKTAVVTGASRGIGFAIARRLLEEDCRYVALMDISEEGVKESALQLDGTGQLAGGYRVDVSDRESVRMGFAALAEKIGPVDILVNNAGITRDAMFHKMTDDQWDTVLNVNLTGMYNCTKQVIPAMRERKYGKIVNLASVSAFGNLGQTNYGAAKAGVIGYTKCLAREAARYNITVNCVAPSYVNTDMLRAVPDEVMQRFLNAIPLGRLGEPDELAAAVAFLCSDDSSFVTGECLVVSGGSYM